MSENDSMETSDHAPDVAVATMPETHTDTETRTDEDTRTKRQPPYNVIIVNDEEHTFEYVIELLTKVFRHSVKLAETLTWKIHTTGRAIVFTTHRELAELKREQVVAYGPDHRLQASKGPLICYIEPAPGD
jgi:ATP-dependent Clp protease adaptor protein ClpS